MFKFSRQRINKTKQRKPQPVQSMHGKSYTDQIFDFANSLKSHGKNMLKYMK